jgi:single-strand DNA-binding protein
MFKNHIDLIGFIGSDPETRQLENGACLTSFSLATKTSWKNESGAYDSRTEWHRIVVWGKLAHFAGTLQKGAHVEIEGQLRYRTYQKEVPNGNKKAAVEVTVSEVHASAIRKLDRNSSSAPDDQDLSDEAPA